MKKRAIKVAVSGVILLVCGLLYGWICITTGVAIPCVFHKLTGYSCPGCGISRMCINILKGNILEAIKCNPVIFFGMIPFFVIISDGVFRYIKTGERKLRKWQNVVLYILIGVLLVYGVLRNIPIH